MVKKDVLLRRAYLKKMKKIKNKKNYYLDTVIDYLSRPQGSVTTAIAVELEVVRKQKIK